MNKFKKYLSENPDAAERFEKTGSPVEKSAGGKISDLSQKVPSKSGDKSSAK